MGRVSLDGYFIELAKFVESGEDAKPRLLLVNTSPIDGNNRTHWILAVLDKPPRVTPPPELGNTAEPTRKSENEDDSDAGDDGKDANGKSRNNSTGGTTS